MAIRYVNAVTGVDSGSALTPATAWKNIDYAETNCTTNDLINVTAGTYLTASTSYVFDRALTWNAASGAILQATGATAEVLRISGAIGAGSVWSLGGFTIDGTGVTEAMEISTGANAWTYDLTGVTLQNGTARVLNVDYRIGAGNIRQCTIGGVSPIGINIAAASASVSAMTLNVSKNAIDVSFAGSVTGITNQRNLAEIAGSNLIIEDNDIDVTTTVGGSYNTIGLDIRGWTTPTITGCTINVTTDVPSSNASGYGVWVRGVTAQATTGAIINENTVRGNVFAGHLISMGTSTSAAGVEKVTGSECVNNIVIGADPALMTSQTPHNITFGQDSTGVMAGNYSKWGYVGYLASAIDGGAILEGNIAVDHKGPFYYAKGCDGAIIRNNFAYSTGAKQQIDRAILSVEEQTGPITTTAVSFLGNIVYVSDISKIFGLAAVAVGQTGAVFTSNKYYLPNDAGISPTVNLLFGLASTTMNSTINQWLAVYTTDIIDYTTYSKAEIDAIIASKSRVPTSGNAGSSSGLIGGLISGLIN